MFWLRCYIVAEYMHRPELIGPLFGKIRGVIVERRVKVLHNFRVFVYGVAEVEQRFLYLLKDLP